MAKKSLYKPGQSGNPHGRPKGSVNRKTQEFMTMLEQKGFDPGEAYVDLFFKQLELYNIRREKNPANISGASEILTAAGQTLNNICQFVYPKKKAIEHTGEVGVKTFADFIAASKGKGS